MKLLLILVLFATVLIAQSSDEVKMIQTEYAFAKNTSEVGTRQSFLNFIADDGILFKPFPVNGKLYLEKSQNKSGVLEWYPTKSKMSSCGDMGFTSGPWTFRKDIDSAEIGFGHFCTIWVKQKDGSFKFAIDYGISHGKITEKVVPLNIDLVSKKKIEKTGRKFPVTKLSVIEKDGSLPIQNVYSATSTLFIDEHYPIPGKASIDFFFKKESLDKINYMRNGGKISKSNDFGFTYGTVQTKSLSNKEKDYYYFRVWQLQKGKWIVLSETWNPVN